MTSVVFGYYGCWFCLVMHIQDDGAYFERLMFGNNACDFKVEYCDQVCDL